LQLDSVREENASHQNLEQQIINQETTY